MADEQHPWAADWTVGVRVRVERAGQAVLDAGRLELLEAIERRHSISAAARDLGMSYRHAWLLVRRANEAAGAPLVNAITGGSHGGGARLTPRGSAAVAVFRRLQEQLHQAAAGLLPRLVGHADSPAVHVAAAVSLEEVLGRLLADYALRQPAVRVRALFGGSDEVADHLLAGAPADLFLTANGSQLDRLEAAGLVQPGTRTPLAENSLAGIGPADGELPVRRVADLARADVLRIALADPACPLGEYTRGLLLKKKLYEKLLPRVTPADNSRAVVAAVRAGRADVGLVYGSDAARADGCRLLFRVRRLPVPIRYEAAVILRGQQPTRALELLRFLAAPAAAGRFRGCGFLPLTPA